MRKTIAYNERAWAIDLISEINRITSTGRRKIKRAGGEWGLSGKSKTPVLFPDVLLFGDPSQCAVLQGWELKMPDTPVTDSELLDNAKEKSQRLGLTSFLVWNGIDAVLHVKSDRDWEILKGWRCEGIASRDDVQKNQEAWRSVLKTILEDINDYFEEGKLSSEKPLPAQLNAVVESLLAEWASTLADHFIDEGQRSLKIRTAISSWWRGAGPEHGLAGSRIRHDLLAKEILLHWAHRFLFVRYLRRFVSDAGSIEKWNESTTIAAAEEWFQSFSANHDYAQIFRTHPCATRMPRDVWQVLLTFNKFLGEARIAELEQQLFQETLQSVRSESQRKIAGQYCTPEALASFLAQLAVDDLTANVLDPCCGTGMIARQVVELKTKSGISPAQAIRTTWASDRYAMPLQFAELALVSGDAPDETLRVFQQDASALMPGQRIPFVNSRTGKTSLHELPAFPCIVLNPPFVRFEDWMSGDSSIEDIRKFIAQRYHEKIDAKSDYFVPILLNLWRVLTPNGRAGVVMPNAWLGADWGTAFRRILRKMFSIEAVVISGKGRWFDNADIVTTLVVMQKKADSLAADRPGDTVFAMTKRPLDEWSENVIEGMRDCIVDQSSSGNDDIQINRISQTELDEYDGMGLSWVTHFSDLNWMASVKPALVSVSSFFTVGRGERRGWDKLFFPPKGEKIEKEYIRPVLHSAADVKGLCATPDGRAFCCSRTIDELKKRGDYGALNWIQRFRHAKNEKGRPLTASLARGGCHWYEMKSGSIADLAVSMNPGYRLFFMRMSPPAFVNQRLIRLVAKKDVDVDLCHALLCSIMGCFYLEALGFGRGLGALDINATKVSKQMMMLDPSKVSFAAKRAILGKFEVLKRRNVLNLEEELVRKDRKEFEKAVFLSYGLQGIMPKVQESLLSLFRLRSAVQG